VAFWSALVWQFAQEAARNPRSLALARGPLGTRLIGTTKVVPFHKSRSTVTRETCFCLCRDLIGASLGKGGAKDARRGGHKREGGSVRDCVSIATVARLSSPSIVLHIVRHGPRRIEVGILDGLARLQCQRQHARPGGEGVVFFVVVRRALAGFAGKFLDRHA